MAVFKKELYNRTVDILKNIINYLEDELSLSTILFSKQEENIKIDNLKEILMSYKSDLNNKKNYNGLKNIYFGFNLPGLFKSIGQLNKIIKRNIIIIKDNNELEKILVEEIYAKDKIKDILSNKDKNEILFLYKDYILYYILLRIKIRTNKKKTLIYDLIDKIIQLKLYSILNDKENICSLNCIDQIIKNENNEKYLINIFAKIILFLEYNIEFISNIIYIFIDFIDIIPNFIEEFTNIAKRNYTNNDTPKEKYILPIIFDSFLDTINDQSKFSFYFTNDKKKYIELLKKNFIYMKFISKKIDSLSIRNIEIFIECIKNKSDNLLKWILDMQKTSGTINIINNISLNKIKENSKNLVDNDYTTLLNILIKLYQNEKSAENKIKIIEYILSDKKFIKDSFYLNFFYSTFQIKEFEDNKENKNEYIFLNENDIDKNEYIFLNENETIENKYNEIIGKNNNKYLIEILIYYFEIYQENKYFKKGQKENLEKDDYFEILGNGSLKKVIYAYDYYENNFKKNKKNLKLLYMVAYLKIYFKYYAKIIYKCENKPELFPFKSIVDGLNLNQNTLEPMKLLHIYILELILEQCKKKESELKDFIKKKNIDYLMKYYKNISESINEKNVETNYFMFCYETPSIKLLKERIVPVKNPSLKNLFENENTIVKLNKLPFINKIANIMLDFLSYKKTKDEIQKTTLKSLIVETEFIDNNNFEKLMENYIKNYNSLIDDSKKIDYNNYGNYSLDYFVVEENSGKNLLYNIYKDFINNQNQFIESLINDEGSEELNDYLKNTKMIYVQDAKESDIPKILEDNKLFEVIIKNCFITFSFDSNNNIIYNENYKKVNFNYDEIGKILIYEFLPEMKKFYPAEYGIRKIKLKGDVYKSINDDIINDYGKKFNYKNIDEKGKKIIIDFIKKQKKEDIYELLLSLQYLMIHILSSTTKYKNSSNIAEDNDIVGVIESVPEGNRWIKFELLKQLFNIKGEEETNKNIIDKTLIKKEKSGGNEILEDNEFDYMGTFNSIINTPKDKKDNDYKLNQLISIFDICKNLYE